MQVLKPGGVHSFFVIDWAEHLSEAEKTATAIHGKEFMDSGPGYRSLMDTAGFDDIVVDDVTAQYQATLEAWISEIGARADDVIRVVGKEVFEDRKTRRTSDLQAVRRGQMRRLLVTGFKK